MNLKKQTHLVTKFTSRLISKNCFSNFIPIDLIPINLNEQDIDVVIDEIVNDEGFQKSGTETEAY